jgi:hypothetical protein
MYAERRHEAHSRLPSPVLSLSRKDATWLACPQKSCCYTSIVIPTGADVWRIARTLELPPTTFLMYFESPAPSRDAFALDGSERRFRIALAKRPTEDPSSMACIFLLRTRAEHHRCGLGELRPAVCQCFPCTLVNGLVAIAPDTDCACRPWSLADVDVADERPRLLRRQAEAEEYCAVVARWNAEVMQADRVFDFAGYCAFLLDAYDSLHAPTTAAPST